MQYVQKQIASRIKQERKALGKEWTKERFAEYLHVNRNTITRWERQDEKGDIPPLNELLKMCGLFGCEVGYLLCEYGSKTRAETDIQEKTGLSPKAVEILVEWAEANNSWPDNAQEKMAIYTKTKVLSFIIEHGGTGEGLTGFFDELYAFLFGRYYSPMLRGDKKTEKDMHKWIVDFKEKEGREPIEEEYESQFFKLFDWDILYEMIPIAAVGCDGIAIPFCIDSKTLSRYYRDNAIEAMDELKKIAKKSTPTVLKYDENAPDGATTRI